MASKALLVLLVTSLAGCGPPAPGEMAFDAATSRLLNWGPGTAHGNSPEARRLAEEFAGMLRGRLVEIGPQGAGFRKGESLPVFCELRSDRVCFLVRVPRLRLYGEEARASLLRTAWESATAATRDLRRRRDRKVGVGLRGAFAYGGMALGMGSEVPTSEQGTIVAWEALYGFFAEEKASGDGT